MKAMFSTGRQGLRLARFGCAVAAGLLFAAGPAFAAQTPDTQAQIQAPPPADVQPWVADVVKMNDAGIAPDVIQNYIRNTGAHSTLSADDIIYLRDRGISTGLITTMIQHGAVDQYASAPAPQPAPAQTAPPYPAYAQAPQNYQSAPDYAVQPPTTVYYNYSYPSYGYSYPYYSYYPYYPVWYYPFGFGFGRGFRGGRLVAWSGSHGGGGGGGFHGGFGGGGMGGHGGHR